MGKTPKKKAGGSKNKKSPSTKNFDNLPPFISLESFLGDLGADSDEGERSPLDAAQDLIYDAFETQSKARRIALAKKALTISTDCADAYNLLAAEEASTLAERLRLYTQAVEAGERAIGRKRFREMAGHFWGFLETRPYMRARLGLALSLWEAGEGEKAIEHVQDMLRLNPNDNQGVRYILLLWLIEKERLAEAEKLLAHYKGDPMAWMLYSKGLIKFKKDGASKAANTALAKAIKENSHVPDYLLSRKQFPRGLPDHYGFGDDNEAVLYAVDAKKGWQLSPGALDWLAAQIKCLE